MCTLSRQSNSAACGIEWKAEWMVGRGINGDIVITGRLTATHQIGDHHQKNYITRKAPKRSMVTFTRV